MKYTSAAFTIVQLLVLSSAAKAFSYEHHYSGLSRRGLELDADLYTRHDILDTLTTRDLVEELEARLDRRSGGKLAKAGKAVLSKAKPVAKKLVKSALKDNSDGDSGASAPAEGEDGAGSGLPSFSFHNSGGQTSSSSQTTTSSTNNGISFDNSISIG